MPSIPQNLRPNKKGGEQSRLHTAVVGITLEEKIKMLALSASICLSFFL